MIALIFIMVLISWIIAESKKFDYIGLKFQRIMFDKLPLYYAQIPIEDKYGNIINYLNLYLREDPRRLKRINVTDYVVLDKESYVAADPSIDGCEKLILAGSTLGSFLRDAGIHVTSGSTNKTTAIDNDIEYIECNESKKTVIMWAAGNVSEIKKEGNCYIMQAANCEIMNVTERMMVAIYAHSAGIKI